MQSKPLFYLAVGALIGACAQAAIPRGLAAAAATVTHVREARAFVAPSGKARIRHLARGEAAYVGRLEMDPGGGVPEHQDPTEEYIHVLSGGGTIHVDGVAHVISEGSTVYMPALAKVRFENGDAPLVALQVFAGPAPAAKYDAWKPE